MIAKNNPKATNMDTLMIPCAADSASVSTEMGSVYFTIENKPFRIYTVFFIGNRDKLKKELKKHEKLDISELQLEDEKTFSGLTIPCMSSAGHSFVLVWMPTFGWTLEDLETLSHECLHATIMVMRMSGVRSKIFSAEDDDSCDDEGICYSQSSMFSSILSELVRKQHKKLYKALTSKNKIKK